MQTTTYSTHLARSSAWAKGLALLTLAVGGWALSAGQAHARGNGDVYWSIGVEQPGVSVGVSNAPPPRPVIIHQPPPVVIHHPAPVVIQQPYPYVRPVVVQQPYPYVVQPRPVYYQGWGYGPRWDDRHDRRHWKRHHRHNRHWDDGDRRGRGDDRWDDDDDDRRGGGHRR